MLDKGGSSSLLAWKLIFWWNISIKILSKPFPRLLWVMVMSLFLIRRGRRSNEEQRDIEKYKNKKMSSSPPSWQTSKHFTNRKKSCRCSITLLFYIFLNLNAAGYNDIYWKTVFLSKAFVPFLFQHDHTPQCTKQLHTEMFFPVWWERIWLTCTWVLTSTSSSTSQTWPPTTVLGLVSEWEQLIQHLLEILKPAASCNVQVIIIAFFI